MKLRSTATIGPKQAARAPLVSVDFVNSQYTNVRQNMFRQSGAGIGFTGKGTTPPTVTNRVSYLGKTCASATFTTGLTGYSTSRFTREDYLQVTMPVARWNGQVSISLSRVLTGSETLLVYWTGAFATGSMNIAVSASGTTTIASSECYNAWRTCYGTGTNSGTGAIYPVVYVSTALTADITVYMTDCQMEVGGSALGYGSYMDTTSKNLFVWSDHQDTASWSKNNASVVPAPTIASPMGTVGDVVKLIENSAASVQHMSAQYPITTAGVVYTTSVYVKAAERAFTRVIIYNGGSDFYGVYVNLTTGAVTVSDSSTLSSKAYAVTDAGNGWWRISATAASPAATFGIYINTSTTLGTVQYTGDGTSGIYLWGAQLEEGAAPSPYVKTYEGQVSGESLTAQSVDYLPGWSFSRNAVSFAQDVVGNFYSFGSNIPRIVPGRGILVEDARTNLILQSQTFETTWTVTACAVTSNNTTAPDGSATADKITADGSGGTYLYQNVASVAGTAAVLSVYVKAGTGGTVGGGFGIRNTTTATNLLFITINYSTLALSYDTGASGGYVEQLANGWLRVVCVVTSGITSGDGLRAYVGFKGSTAANGDNFYAWGAQLEVGTNPTSYITTTTASVTRPADVPIINVINQTCTGGTIYAEVETQAIASSAASQTFASLSTNNNSTSYVILSKASGVGSTTGAYSRTSAAAALTGISTSPDTIAAGAIQKLAARYSEADTDAFCITNGTTKASAAKTATPRYTGTEFRIGRWASNPGSLNCYVRCVKLFPDQLTDSELQGLIV